MGNNPGKSRIDLTVSAKNRQYSFIRQMRFRFLVTILLLCMDYIFGYSITRENIDGRKMDAAFVNLSGRQRMLSQRIAVFSLRLATSQDELEQKKLRENLSDTVKSMEAAHQILVHGAEERNRALVLSEALKAIYFSEPINLDKQLHIYFDEAEALLNFPDAKLAGDNPHLRRILSASYADLINSLEKAVRQYELESKAGILRFENTEFYLVIIKILILLLIALFIFWPMTTHIQRNIQALTIANEFSENLIKTIPFGMDIVDRDGAIVYLNEKFKALFGEGVIGKKCYEVYKDDRQVCDNCPLKKGIRIGKTDVADVDGILGARTFRISHTGIVYHGKKSVLEVFEDITEEKKSEERLKSLAIKSDFVSMVSHELRTPLTAIKEGIAIVMDGSAGSINAEQKEFLEIAEKNVERLTRLINNVLDFQRLESGRLIFDMQEADINDAVREAEQIMANSAKNKGLEFIVELAEDLPKITFDSDKISQVLINLVNNAIKFTEKGYIKIKTSKTEDAVCVSVQDTGIGIKEEDVSSLFQGFSQLARGAERQAGSTGLGLAISEKIIRQHKGKIWLESEYGKGSTFYFVLPVEKK